MKDAFEKSDCYLKEPVMKVEVVVPDDYIGDVIGDRVLARNLYRAFAPGESMSASVDTIISLFSTRMRQYREVRSQS